MEAFRSPVPSAASMVESGCGVRDGSDGDELQRERPEVGQHVWVIVNHWRGKPERVEGEVTKVGRKYVTITWGEWAFRHPVQFNLETGVEKSDYSGNLSRYYTFNEMIEVDRRKAALAVLREAGLEPKGYGRCTISTDKLEAVAKVLAE